MISLPHSLVEGLKHIQDKSELYMKARSLQPNLYFSINFQSSIFNVERLNNRVVDFTIPGVRVHYMILEKIEEILGGGKKFYQKPYFLDNRLNSNENTITVSFYDNRSLSITNEMMNINKFNNTIIYPFTQLTIQIISQDTGSPVVIYKFVNLSIQDLKPLFNITTRSEDVVIVSMNLQYQKFSIAVSGQQIDVT